LFVAIRLPPADCGLCEKTIIRKALCAYLTGPLDDGLRADESNAGVVCMNLRQITARGKGGIAEQDVEANSGVERSPILLVKGTSLNMMRTFSFSP
jgi:hypothetical protein